jgi:hypothetical protein
LNRDRPAREHHGGNDDNISLIDYNCVFKLGQIFPEEVIDGVKAEVEVLDRRASRWLQQHKSGDLYRAVCTTVLAKILDTASCCVCSARHVRI